MFSKKLNTPKCHFWNWIHCVRQTKFCVNLWVELTHSKKKLQYIKVLWMLFSMISGGIYFQEFNNQDKHEALNYLVFVYRATKFEGEIQETNEGEIVWKSIEEFMQLSIWDGDKIFVPKFSTKSNSFSIV